ncbi:MAG: UDP-glucose/GDP-mannose dehydrogenase family protein [Candidatus Omnitrophica bacterium]|nr:UDP-glucose/GDP-mannose dehydrogenase family protein [Candidatus Omnitrophota bacterium]
MRRIAVVGTGKLGLPMMAAMASRGFYVTGYDTDRSKINKLKKGSFPYEPGLKELIRKHRGRLRFTSYSEDMAGASLIFVIVPTPSTSEGAFSVEAVKNALTSVGRVLSRTRDFKVVGVVSTVLPGSMDMLRRHLEKVSDKTCGRDFGLCYSPAFIALGSVVRDFLHPDFVLMGESDPKAGDLLQSFQRRLCGNDVKIHRTNFVNAELAKISVNTYITMKISFANTLSRLCEKIPGADGDVITRVLGSDHRIGPHYLKGALGYGGPCFPRDNKAFGYAARQCGVAAWMAGATDRTNRQQVLWLKRLVLRLAGPRDTVGVLGLSYKPDTDVVEESQGVALVQALVKSKKRLVVYDPAAMAAAKRVLKKTRVVFAGNLSEVLKRSDVVVITTPWPSFRKFKSGDMRPARGRSPKRIVDPWRILEGHPSLAHVKYIGGLL